MYSDTSLARSLQIQVRVIGALLMREIITRYGRHNIGFLWLFVEPLLFTIGVVFLWSATEHLHSFRLPIVPFVVTGYSSVLLWRSCTSRALTAIESNLSLLYHRNVRLFDIFIARMLLEVAGTTMSFIFVIVVMILIGLMQPPVDVLTMLVGWLLLAWFSIALAIILGCLSQRSDVVERFWHPISYFMLPISGAFFMVEWLPSRLWDWALYVPMVHSTEMLRGGYFGQTSKVHFSVTYMLLVCSVMTLIGFLLIRDTRVHLESG